MLALHPMRAVLANALAAAPSPQDLVLLLLVRGAAPRMAPAGALAVLPPLAIFDVSGGSAGVTSVLLIVLLLIVAVVFLVIPPFHAVVFLVVNWLSAPLLVIVVVVIFGVVFVVPAPLRNFGRLSGLLKLLIEILPQIFQCPDLLLEYVLLLKALLKRAPGA